MFKFIKNLFNKEDKEDKVELDWESKILGDFGEYGKAIEYKATKNNWNLTVFYDCYFSNYGWRYKIVQGQAYFYGTTLFPDPIKAQLACESFLKRGNY